MVIQVKIVGFYVVAFIALLSFAIGVAKQQDQEVSIKAETRVDEVLGSDASRFSDPSQPIGQMQQVQDSAPVDRPDDSRFSGQCDANLSQPPFTCPADLAR